MKGYQLKAVIKKTKPPMWKRFQIPAGITFAQLSIVLEEILEQDHTDRYEFEFFQGHVHLREWRGKDKATTKYDFDYKCSADTFIDLVLSILVYTFFSRMFDLMLPPVAKHSIVVA